jgi:hypothetical protein
MSRLSMKSYTPLLFLILFLLDIQSVISRDIHVSTIVAVTGDGSSEAPYKTIQEAAQLAVEGDRVIIHAGTYRETVTPANSGTANAMITYMPFNDDIVTIDGSDLVTNWSIYRDEIYRAYFKMTLGA